MLLTNKECGRNLPRISLQGFLLLLGMLCFAVGADAQVRFGSVVGFVADSNGAAVVGAKVTLTNQGTNESSVLTTGPGGTYAFGNVMPGQYRVDIEVTGFKHFTVENVRVEVDVATRVDAKLEIGNVSETIQVQANAVTLQTDSSSLGSVVTEQTIQNMPVSGQNVNNLMTLVPGVSAGGTTYGSASGNQLGGELTNAQAFGNYFIGGAFGNQSAFFVDGVSSNGAGNNLNGVIVSPDFVEEFRVATNNVSAEYGNYAGGVINISTKSGTNAFHGAGYDYLRNKVLNANDFFSKHAGIARPQLIQNQFGGDIGGPILPRKVFFFFGYAGTQTHSSALSTTTIPTAAELSGDFSAPGLPPIYDHSQSGDPQFSCNGVLNVICPSRIDPTAKAILADSFPASGPNQPGSLVNNYIVHFPTGGVQDLYDARVDESLGSKNQVFARYLHSKVISPPYDAWGTHTQGGGVSGLYSQEGVVGDTYTLNQSTLLDVHASYLRYLQVQSPDSTNINLSKYGPTFGNLASQLVGGATRGGGSIPSSSFNGTNGFPATNLSGDSGVGAQAYWQNNILALTGNLLKSIGKHQLKIGANIRRVQWIAESNTQALTLTYDNEETASPTAPSTTGAALASNLLGVPLETSVGNVGESAAYYTNYGFFGEDTYQVSRKLTATLGLRWDQPSVYSESHNKDTVFLPNDAASVGGVTSYTNPISGSTQPVKGLLTLVGSQAWSSQREDYLHWNLFAPRIGLAYRVNDETVVRSGYGLSYLPQTLAQDGPSVSPINQIGTLVSNTFQVTTGQPDQIIATTANPFPNGINQPPGRAANLANYFGGLIPSRVPGDKLAYQQQWNLAIERQIGKNGTVSVAYAGSKGTHLLIQGFATASNLNINQVPDQYLALGVTALEAPVPNPFGSGTIPAGDLLKPFPQYNRVLDVDPHRGFSSYNSLQVALNKKIWAGGEVVAAYTWSKLMSNTDSVTNFLEPGFIFGGTIQDNTSLTKTERSLSEYDIPQNLTFGYTLPLPFGKDRTYLHNANPIVEAIVGGWDVHGITTIMSGPPLAMVEFESPVLQQFGAGNGFIFAPGEFIRPDVVPGCKKNVGGSRYTRALNGWFNTSCFTNTTSETAFGNESRVDAQIRTDGTDNWDLALSKETPLSDGVKVRFSAEAYNLFNRAQFSGPGAIAGLQGYTGVVTATSFPPRNIEFLLRLSF